MYSFVIRIDITKPLKVNCIMTSPYHTDTDSKLHFHCMQETSWIFSIKIIESLHVEVVLHKIGRKNISWK